MKAIINQEECSGCERVLISIKIEDGDAIVEVEKGTSCASCSTRCVCNYGAKTVLVKAENPLSARQDQVVQVSISEGIALQAAFVVYIIPLITFIGGVFLGAYIGERVGIETVFEILGGIGGLALAFPAIKYYNTSVKRHGSYQPVVTRIIENELAST